MRIRVFEPVRFFAEGLTSGEIDALLGALDEPLDARKSTHEGGRRWNDIGLDVHAASTTFAVIGESGKRLRTHVEETNGQALVEQLTTIPGAKHVCLEEGTKSVG